VAAYYFRIRKMASRKMIGPETFLSGPGTP